MGVELNALDINKRRARTRKIVTQQNSYSISHLLGTVTTQ